MACTSRFSFQELVYDETQLRATLLSGYRVNSSSSPGEVTVARVLSGFRHPTNSLYSHRLDGAARGFYATLGSKNLHC